MPPWLKTLSTGALKAGMANVRRTAGISLSYVALLRTQKSTGSESQSPSIARKYLAKSSATETSVDLQDHSEVVCYSAIDLVGTKDLKKGLAGRASKSKSKSKSIAFKSKSKCESLEPKSKSKSKSSKNGLKSGLESKSELEYYKSDDKQHFCAYLKPFSR